MSIDYTQENKESLLIQCHKLRELYGNLKQLNDEELIVYALNMYKRKREKILKNKGIKNIIEMGCINAR